MGKPNRFVQGHPKVGAIIDAFMPGQFAAEATMQLLLGEASPSGLLPITNYDKVKRPAFL